MRTYLANSEYSFEIYGTDDAAIYKETGEWEKIYDTTVTSDANKWVALDFDTTEYRYVKILFTNATSWAALYELEVSYREVETQYATVKGENLMPGVPSAKASTTNSTYYAYKSFDGKINTRWCSTGNAPQWLAYDLGTTRAVSQIQLQLNPSVLSTYANKDVNYEIYGTNDVNVWNDVGDWTKISSGTVKTDASAMATITFSEENYQYIKILFTEKFPGGWPTISEVTMYSEADTITNLLTSYKSSTNEDTSTAAGKSFDGDTSTQWLADAEATSSSPQWIAYDLGAKKTFDYMELLYSDAGKSITYEICGTNDVAVWNGTGDWETISRGTAVSDAKKRFYLEFEEAEYQYLKVLFYESDGIQPNIYEINLFNCTVGETQVANDSIRQVAGRYDLINPQAFTEKYDVMFDYLADNGMIIALGYGVHTNTISNMTEEELAVLSRYLTARYASYPVVWITGQEINISDAALERWIESAEVVDEWDGYNHPQGAHVSPLVATNSKVTTLNGEEWHEWWAYQNGHGPLCSKARYKGYWDTGKLFLETENNYEDITCGSFTGYENSRIGAWLANLCGSYGYTYGATGIWANIYSTAGNVATSWLKDFGYEPWYMGLDKAGSFEMTYLKKFFVYAQFNTLIPRFTDTAYADFATTENKLVSSRDDASTYVGYFYNSDYSTGEFRGLNTDEEYTARWYNPLTGKFIDIEDVEITANGTYTIPDKPTIGDWAILVTSRDLGEYETEEAYKEITSEGINLARSVSVKSSSGNNTSESNDGNLSNDWSAESSEFPQWLAYDLGLEQVFNQVNIKLKEKEIAKASSSTDEDYYPVQSIDGDTGTYWCANGNAPGWIAYDLGITRAVAQIQLQLNKSALATYANKPVYYEIYGTNDTAVWNDTGDWNLISSGTATTDASAKATIAFTEVEYQYIKILFTRSFPGGWPAIWEVEMYSETDTDTNLLTLSKSSVNENDKMTIGVYGSSEASAWNSAGDTAGWTKLGEISATEADDDNWITLVFDQAQYQYVKIFYTDGNGESCATASEVEIYKATELTDVPEYLGQVQTPTIDCVGGAIYTTADDLTDTKANLVDKDYDTCFIPYAPIATQTFIMDLQKEMSLTGIIVTLGEDAYLPEYRVEASSNGTDWTILADATLRGSRSIAVSGREKMYEELSGEYRYVKLFWLNADDNTTTKTIAEIELYAYEKADKSLLEQEIKKAENVDLNEYQDDTAKEAFEDELAEAKAVYDKVDATQAEADEAKEALTESMKLLEKKVNDTPTTPTTPSDEVTGGDNNSNNTTTEENTGNSTAEENVGDTTTEENARETTTEESVESTTTEENVGETTTEESVENTTTEENVGETTAEESVENTTTAENPNTGDENDVTLWLVTGFFAVMAMAGMLILKRKTRRAKSNIGAINIWE